MEKSRIQAKISAARKRLGDASAAELQAIEKRAERQHINRTILTAIAEEASKPVQLSWLPTSAARVSFFRPVADQNLKAVHTDLTYKSAWGSLQVFGPGLNIVDEGIFLSILQCVKAEKKPVIKINLSQICRLLGISEQTKNRNRIKQGIKKLAQTSFTFEMRDGAWSVEHILSKAGGKMDFSIIEVDPWFYSSFLSNEITLIDLKFRQSLRGDIVKSLYRFIKSHRGTQKYLLQTLIEVLNLDPNRELKLNRRALKAAFGQLRNKGFLSFKFKDDLFYDIRSMGKKLLES